MDAVPDRRFPRALRIRTTREYRWHRQRARSFRTEHYLVSWAPARTPQGRLGLTVSRKVGNSPQRSRVKRVLRSWYRLYRLELVGQWDLVIVARSGAPGLGLAEAKAELDAFVRWINRRSAGR